MRDNSRVNERVVFDSFRSSDRPSKKWVANNEINEKSGQVPQPRQLEMNAWQSLLSKLPIVSLDLIIWSREVLVSLTKVKSWDEEDENSENERHEESEGFLTDKDSKVLVLSLEESGTDSRNIEEHGNTNLDEAFNDTVLLLLERGHIIGFESTCIE